MFTISELKEHFEKQVNDVRDDKLQVAALILGIINDRPGISSNRIDGDDYICSIDIKTLGNACAALPFINVETLSRAVSVIVAYGFGETEVGKHLHNEY